MARLFSGAVVIGREIDRAFVNFVKQQAGDFGQSRLGVAHGGGTIAVARTKVALAVNQRVALAEILRHAHQSVVGGLVAMRVKPTQHIAHHPRALDRAGAGVAIGTAKAQAHAGHRVQNAALNRLLAITHIRQRAAFDHAQGVLQVGTLGVVGQVQVIVALGLGDGGKFQGGWITH